MKLLCNCTCSSAGTPGEGCSSAFHRGWDLGERPGCVSSQLHITSSALPCPGEHTAALNPISVCAGSVVKGRTCPASGAARLAQAEVWPCWSGALFLRRGQNPLLWGEMRQTTELLLLVYFSIVNCWDLLQWSWLMSFLSNAHWFLEALMNMYWKVEQILSEDRRNCKDVHKLICNHRSRISKLKQQP